MVLLLLSMYGAQQLLLLQLRTVFERCCSLPVQLKGCCWLPFEIMPSTLHAAFHAAEGLGAVAGCPSRTAFLPTGAAVCPHFSVMFKGGTSSGTAGSYGRLWYDEMRCTVAHLSLIAGSTLVVSAESLCGLFAPYMHVVRCMLHVLCCMLYEVCCVLHTYTLYGSNDNALAGPCAIHVTGPMSHLSPSITQSFVSAVLL